MGHRLGAVAPFLRLSPFEAIASKLSLRRCRFEAVASLWLAFFSLQGRSLQGCSPPALHQATGRALGQHSGGSIPAFVLLLIARRAHRTSGLSRVGGHLWSGVHPATGRNRRLDVPLPSVSCFSGCPASLGVPLPTPLSGLSRGRLRNLTGFSAKFALRPWVSLGRGAQAALPSRLAFCGAAFCGAAFRGAVSRRAVSRRAVSRLF